MNEVLDLIGNRREGILAGVTRQGYPHLTNIWYVWDPGRRIARVSTTADRVTGRIFRRDPHAARDLTVDALPGEASESRYDGEALPVTAPSPWRSFGLAAG
jgi:Pyridoxamine 5'-phosphate oxidase